MDLNVGASRDRSGEAGNTLEQYYRASFSFMRPVSRKGQVGKDVCGLCDLPVKWVECFKSMD